MVEKKGDNGTHSLKGENMWDAARQGNADRKKFAAVLPGSKQSQSDDFAEISVSPTFKPINPKAKSPRDDYEVAMTGPAAFMTPPPEKKKVAKAPSGAGLTNVTSGAIPEAPAEEDKQSRSKLPVFAALAASLVAVAVLGVQSWHSATASTSRNALSNSLAISETDTGTSSAAIAGFGGPQSGDQNRTAFAAIQGTKGIPQPTDSESPFIASSQISGFGTPSKNPGKAMHVAMATPTVGTGPMTDAPAAPRAEFVPLPSGISKTSNSVVSLSRTDCAARFDTVSRSGSINFESSSATLLRSSQPILNFFANVFEHCREFTIAVAGHTDSTGDANYNKALSQKRAASVAQYLVEIGVPKESLRVVGYGESRPIASNDTALKRSRNRRIEFSIFDG
jgi:outer membrane protein OmpA-like peptidoglycan-associated protein